LSLVSIPAERLGYPCSLRAVQTLKLPEAQQRVNNYRPTGRPYSALYSCWLGAGEWCWAVGYHRLCATVMIVMGIVIMHWCTKFEVYSSNRSGDMVSQNFKSRSRDPFLATFDLILVYISFVNAPEEKPRYSVLSLL